MKQFLYLDYDVVNSIIAQKENGLNQAVTTRNESDSSSDQQVKKEVGAQVTAGGSFFSFLQTNIGTNVSGSKDEGFSQHKVSEEILQKTMHDAAFDVAYKYINPIKCDFSNNLTSEYGEYVELDRVFDFVDLEYLKKLCSPSGVFEYLRKGEKENAKKQVDSTVESTSNRQLKVIAQDLKKREKDMLRSIDDSYDEINSIILMIETIMPYSRMLISNDGYLIPLEDKYFRVNPESLGFKYGGGIKCVGMVTNIIGESTNPNDASNIFGTIQFTINEALRKLLPTSEKDIFVIHPVAVYYETQPK